MYDLGAFGVAFGVRESDHAMGWSFPGGCELVLMCVSGAESLRGGGGLEKSRKAYFRGLETKI